MTIDYTIDVSSFDEEALRKSLEKYQQVISNGKAVGGIGSIHSGISIAIASHVVEEAILEYPNLKLQVRVLSTPKGIDLKDFFENGFTTLGLVGLGEIANNRKYLNHIIEISAYAKY